MVRYIVGCLACIWLMSAGNPVVAAGYLIKADLLNGSFETLGGVTPSTLKATHWDADPEGDVDNWTLWDALTGGPAVNVDDSGAEVNLTTATDGTRIAFLQAENGVYNLTSHVVQVGDFFSYSWDWVLAGRGSAVVQLAYQDLSGAIVAIPGTDSTNPNNVTRHLGLGADYTAMAGDPAVGRPIALTIQTLPGNNYPEVDNFQLTVNVGPGDVNADGLTDLADYTIIKSNFFLATEATRAQGDLTRDGRVDLLDYGLWKNNAAPAVLASIGIPEPTGALLAATGIAAFALRGRRRR